jgi:hypothetical protein
MYVCMNAKDDVIKFQMYDEGKKMLKYTPRLCIPLGTFLESLHLLLRW